MIDITNCLEVGPLAPLKAEFVMAGDAENQLLIAGEGVIASLRILFTIKREHTLEELVRQLVGYHLKR